jgi:hypothetical protein
VTWLVIANVVLLSLAVAAILELIPQRLYSGFLRGLHFTIGITTPTDRQLRWTFAAWLISLLAIVDALALTLRFL